MLTGYFVTVQLFLIKFCLCGSGSSRAGSRWTYPLNEHALKDVIRPALTREYFFFSFYSKTGNPNLVLFVSLRLSRITAIIALDSQHPGFGFLERCFRTFFRASAGLLMFYRSRMTLILTIWVSLTVCLYVSLSLNRNESIHEL